MIEVQSGWLLHKAVHTVYSAVQTVQAFAELVKQQLLFFVYDVNSIHRKGKKLELREVYKI